MDADIDNTSSLFERALAQSMAKFHLEIKAHYIASVKHRPYEHLQSVATEEYLRERDLVDVVMVDVSKNSVGGPPHLLAGRRVDRVPTSKDADEPVPDMVALCAAKVKIDSAPTPLLAALPLQMDRATSPIDSINSTELRKKICSEITKADDSISYQSRQIERWVNLVRAYLMVDIDAYEWEVQPIWINDNYRNARLSFARSVKAGRTTDAQMMACRTGDEFLTLSRLQCFVSKPDSPIRLLWTFIGFLMILYDLLLIPMGPFLIWDSPILSMLQQVTLIYWSLDLPGNFLAGFLCNGVVEMRPKKIALRYLRSWFAPDLLLVSSDILFYFAERGAVSANVAKFLRSVRMGRILRIARGVRLVRLKKLSQVLEVMTERHYSQYTVLAMKLCGQLAVIMVLNHYVACGWFAIGQQVQGQSSNEDLNSWLAKADIVEAEPLVQYLLSLHWSITQFFPSANDIGPTCAQERAYAIIIVLFALVVFSSFVSSVTNTINELRRMTQDRTDEENKLREFFSTRRVSVEISMRIWHFHRLSAMRRKRAVTERDIPLFNELPGSLLEFLHNELYAPVLRSHGVLQTFRSLDTALISKICDTCFYDLYEAPDHDLFIQYGECQRVLFIFEGRVTFQREGNGHSTRFSAASRTSSNSTGSEVLDVNSSLKKERPTKWIQRSPSKANLAAYEEGLWISEPALWVVWRHRGLLTTDTHVEIAVLDCVKFHGVFTSVAGPLWRALKGVAAMVCQYAEDETRQGRSVTDINLDQEKMRDFADRSLAFLQKARDLNRSLGSVTNAGSWAPLSRSVSSLT